MQGQWDCVYPEDQHYILQRIGSAFSGNPSMPIFPQTGQLVIPLKTFFNRRIYADLVLMKRIKGRFHALVINGEQGKCAIGGRLTGECPVHHYLLWKASVQAMGMKWAVEEFLGQAHLKPFDNRWQGFSVLSAIGIYTVFEAGELEPDYRICMTGIVRGDDVMSETTNWISRGEELGGRDNYFSMITSFCLNFAEMAAGSVAETASS